MTTSRSRDREQLTELVHLWRHQAQSAALEGHFEVELTLLGCANRLEKLLEHMSRPDYESLIY